MQAEWLTFVASVDKAPKANGRPMQYYVATAWMMADAMGTCAKHEFGEASVKESLCKKLVEGAKPFSGHADSGWKSIQVSCAQVGLIRRGVNS